MSKTIVKNGNVNSFSDTTETSEIVIPKKKFLDGFKHTKFVIDNCRKDIVQYKSERDTLHLQLKELEKVADTQFKLRKELEKKNKLLNDEISIIKGKHQTRYDIDMMPQTDDINVLNKQIEDEVKLNMEQNRIKIIDPYLELLKKKYEI